MAERLRVAGPLFQIPERARQTARGVEGLERRLLVRGAGEAASLLQPGGSRVQLPEVGLGVLEAADRQSAVDHPDWRSVCAKTVSDHRGEGHACLRPFEDAVRTFRGQRSLAGLGIPPAVLREPVFSILGVERTPGLASHSSCPEEIWQAAKWWHEFYESKAALTEAPLAGHHDTGQPSAAVVEPEPRTAPPKKRSAKRS